MPDATSAGTQTVVLRHSGGELELPVRPVTEGSPGVDVTKLLSTTGLVTIDPGFVNTASCSSEITYIDGDAGILATAATRSSNWPNDPASSRSATC